MKQIQNELGRIIDIQVLNNRFENTGQIEKIEIKINNVEINKKIEELTERIEILQKIITEKLQNQD